MAAEKSEINVRALLLVNEERNIHGLRYNDYSRYRRHCAHKVHRLRQVLKMTHGKGREFKKVPPVATENIRDGQLHLLLFECERAWAYAQELLLEYNTSQESSVRRHALSRFRRAINFATQLQGHSSALFHSSPRRITPISHAEISAYVLMIRGRFSRTKDEFQPGLVQLSVARAILDGLGQTATSSRDQALAAVFSDEIGPEIRYCAHELGRSKAYDIDGIVAELAPKHGEATIKGYGDLVGALKAPSASDSRGSSSNKLEPLVWEGQPISVRNPELVDVFLRVQEASKQLDGVEAPSEEHPAPQTSATPGKKKKHRNKSRGRIAAFDAVLSALSEAEDLARKLLEAQQLTNSSKSAGRPGQDGQFIHSYISYLLISRRIQRDLLLIEALLKPAPVHPIAKGKLPESHDAPLDPRVYPAVVKLLDTILQSLEQMRGLSLTDESPDLSTGIDARLSFAKARRCHYVSLAHASMKNFAQSLALNSRAALHLRESRALVSSQGPQAPVELSFFPIDIPRDIEPLTQSLTSDALRLKKEWFAYNGGVATSSINTGEGGKKHKKPLFFDVAFNYIQSPLETLEARAGKEIKAAPVAPPASVPATSSKKGKVDKEEPVEEEPSDEAPPSPQVTQRPTGGLGGLLGSWWGRR